MMEKVETHSPEAFPLLRAVWCARTYLVHYALSCYLLSSPLLPLSWMHREFFVPLLGRASLMPACADAASLPFPRLVMRASLEQTQRADCTVWSERMLRAKARSAVQTQQ